MSRHPTGPTTARRRLVALWDALDGLGATVRRLPLAEATDDEIGALIAGEAERVRVLSAPEAEHHTLAARIAHRTTAA